MSRRVHEPLRAFVLGVDRPFDHTTKVGSVKERTGEYDDALRNKKALVIPMILEAFGGNISPHSLHFIRRLALRAKGARARPFRP